jgi:hypothetical protein
VFNQALGVVSMLELKRMIDTKILLFGRQMIAEDVFYAHQQAQKHWFVFMPNSKFLMLWNALIAVLVLHQSIFLPF